MDRRAGTTWLREGRVGSQGPWHRPPQRGRDMMEQRRRELPAHTAPGPTPCAPLTSGNPTPCRHPGRCISDMSLSPREVGPTEQDVPVMETSKPHVSAVSEKLATIFAHCFLFRITDLAGCCPKTWPECLTSAQRSREADLQLPRHKGQSLRPVGGSLGWAGGLSQAQLKEHSALNMGCGHVRH